MAGGFNAVFVPCRYCDARAARTFEGVTTDTYKCLGCGRAFGIAWGECGGEPTMPQWPSYGTRLAAPASAGDVTNAA